MPVRTVVINTADVALSVDFYATFLQARPVGPVTVESAELDVVTATIRLVQVVDPPASTWVPDDQQRGFRHVGFKVDRVDPLAARLKQAGVSFHLDPLDAEGKVRITFFYDPDGTLLELVEGDLHYTEVLDDDLLAAERALGVPDRPRFDHVAVTVDDAAATAAHYRPLGFSPIGTLAQPHDERGFDITYLKSGDTVLETFTYAVGTRGRDPQIGAPGFQAAVLAGTLGDAFTPVGPHAGVTVAADPDGLLVAAER